jgi:hypothetical protein
MSDHPTANNLIKKHKLDLINQWKLELDVLQGSTHGIVPIDIARKIIHYSSRQDIVKPLQTTVDMYGYILTISSLPEDHVNELFDEVDSTLLEFFENQKKIHSTEEESNSKKLKHQREEKRRNQIVKN